MDVFRKHGLELGIFSLCLCEMFVFGAIGYGLFSKLREVDSVQSSLRDEICFRFYAGVKTPAYLQLSLRDGGGKMVGEVNEALSRCGPLRTAGPTFRLLGTD
jgi:hypothetical protein